MERASISFIVLLTVGACQSTAAGPTPSIPAIPDHWTEDDDVTLAIEDDQDPFEGFARTENPLAFRTQTIDRGAATTDHIPVELDRDRGEQIAPMSAPDYDEVVTRVRGTYLDRLQRCFAGPSRASGKLQLAFTVAESGEVSDASVSGLDASTNACVRKRVMRWSFAKVRKGSGDATIVLSVVVM